MIKLTDLSFNIPDWQAQFRLAFCQWWVKKSLAASGPIHTTSEEFENGDFTVKTRMKCFLSTLRLRNSVENETITGDFGFAFEENTGREIKWLSWPHDFRKAPFSKCFPSRLKRKASVFKFLRFEERFRKAPFSWRFWVEGAPRRRNKIFFSGVVWLAP